MDIENLIKAKLEKIRPFINRHGGDIEFVKFKDGYVYVKMLGACQGCSYVDQTLTYGVEDLLIEEVPGVLGVILVP
ncbi:MAG: NifU family protein [Bacilli bacterium]|jgi:Fe-S cluster biogenesis protein NfuA